MKKKILSTGFLLVAIAMNFLCAQSGWHIRKTFHIQSTGGWDYIAIGPFGNRLYVSHGTQVNILDKTTGDSIGVIPNTTGVHGIAFYKTLNRGYTSNGRLNNVTVFDLTDNHILAQIPTGQNPDAILFEPFTKLIITCNGRSKNLSLIDPIENKCIDSIDVGGKPEAAVSDGAGKLFVNIEDKSEIAVVDLRTRKLVARWSLLPAKEPTGLAYDEKTRRLFAGCSNDLLAVVDADNGKIIATPAIGDGCDGVVFDPLTHWIFSSNGEGSISVYKEKTADAFEFVETIPTKRGARTIAMDEKQLLYLPTADFEPIDPAQPNARPRMKPGSFQVLVVGQ